MEKIQSYRFWSSHRSQFIMGLTVSLELDLHSQSLCMLHCICHIRMQYYDVLLPSELNWKPVFSPCKSAISSWHYNADEWPWSSTLCSITANGREKSYFTACATLLADHSQFWDLAPRQDFLIDCKTHRTIIYIKSYLVNKWYRDNFHPP